MRRIGAIAGIALVAVALAAGCGGDDEESAGGETDTTAETTTEATGGDASSLRGSVGPGFEISLSTDAGERVTSLAPGSYTLEVEDLSSAHNFHLTGPGVDVSTSVADEGSETFELTLEAGSYEFVCDPHATSMRGSFEVTE